MLLPLLLSRRGSVLRTTQHHHHHSSLLILQYHWTLPFMKANTRTISSSTLLSSSSSSSSGTKDSMISREDLLLEAACLTKSLYRICLRSIKVIRWGNQLDDKEFERREEEFCNPKTSPGGGSFSMAPPPNKEDELRSRAEYYHSYAREYFIQESDCLDNDPLHERDIRRYVYYLRKGDKDRKWLLGDMMFPDPYKTALDQERIKKFEATAKKYLGDDEEEIDSGGGDYDSSSSNLPQSDGDDNTTTTHGFMDDEDPEWFRTKYPHLR